MKKGLKITSLALAMSMALGCGIVVSAEETTEETPTPQMSKTVKANDDGTYDVELSVKGSVSTETSVKYTQSDVVIIADHSGSMSSSTSSSNPDILTRWDSLENAVGILADKVLAENTNNRMAFVTFDNDAETMKFGEEYWTSSADEIKGVFDTISYPDWKGTYVAKGFDAANTVLETAYDTSAKYVIFLSDGEAFDESEAIELSDALQTTYGAKVYSVGIPNCDEDFMKKIASSEEDYFYAEDADQLATVFDGIADVVKSGYSDVNISDKLSDYVDYAEYDENGNPVIDITGYDAEGNALDEIVYSIGYSVEGNEILVSFGEDMIPDQYTYKISYKVKPTEYAEEFYAQNGYNAIGDDNTDAEGNTTSSGKDGFAIGESVVSYTYREANYLSSFATPVIQVEEKEESSQESSEEPSEPSEESSQEPSQEESSQEPQQSSEQGKTGKDAPATGSSQNIVFMLAGLAAVSAVISVKAFKAKKSK